MKKNRKGKLFYAIVFIFICTALCCFCVFMNPPKIYQYRQGTTLEVEKGKKFEINIHENASTGYVLYLPDRASTLTTLIRRSYIPFDRFFKRIGSGGYEQYTFLAKNTGIDTIKVYLLGRGRKINAKDESQFIIKIK